MARAVLIVALMALAVLVRLQDPFTLTLALVKTVAYLDYTYFNGRTVDADEQTYDFIVIGGGSAGCAMASRLSEVPDWRVLLIEAGPRENPIMDVPVFAVLTQFPEQVNWGYRTEPSATGAFCASMVDGRCHWPRGKLMGGSSAINFQIYTRGHPRDYDRWAAHGNGGWSYADVEPYFRRAERQVPIAESSFQSELAANVLRGMRQAGLPTADYNRNLTVGSNRIQQITRASMRHSANRAYIVPVARRRNLHTLTRAQVMRILIDAATKRAVGVEYALDDEPRTQRRRAYAGKEVIVSAGAINSPQLLMLSGIGDRAQLHEHGIEAIVHSPHVGANLMDHVSPELIHIVTNGTRHNLYDVFYPGTWWTYLRDGGTVISTAGGCEAIAFDGPDDAHPDVEIVEMTGGYHILREMHAATNIRQPLFADTYTRLKALNVDVFTVLVFALRPKSRGWLRLASADPFEHPLIHPNYFAHPDDLAATMRGIRRLRRILQTDAMRAMNATMADTAMEACRRLARDSDAFWRCQARHLTSSVYHYSGTCRMGRLDDGGVVDEQLRVHGVRGLRVVDASVMPDLVSGHPTAAVYMIAEKAADMVRGDWYAGD